MRYELMLAHQVRTAIDENWPVALPLGVMEYHGEHMALGMDTLAVTKVLERFEWERDIVILPSFTYGAGTYAVAPPERSGALQVNPEDFAPMATGLFRSLLRVGFRNIHFVIHHQSENFAAGMPTDLAFKFAARQAIFAFLVGTRGEGWWGDEAMRDYYAAHKEGIDPFNWIKGHPLMDASTIERYTFDHAGIGDLADAGPLPGSGGLEPARRQHDVVYWDRTTCNRRVWRAGRCDDPRSPPACSGLTNDAAGTRV